MQQNFSLVIKKKKKKKTNHNNGGDWTRQTGNHKDIVYDIYCDECDVGCCISFSFSPFEFLHSSSGW